ncbi:ankyrin repeat-containing domain protein [Cadophora sp. MPI-SDFR-AT-0126]|nr:ankyrin repeat-containing domain protein [Leotiomycetes sp. MPI-SDFR-AT-0126]
MALLRLPIEVLPEVLNGIIEETDIKSFALVNKHQRHPFRNEAVLRRAIRLGADPNTQGINWPIKARYFKLLPGLYLDEYGYCDLGRFRIHVFPLTMAARKGEPTILKMLLDGGAKVEACALYGMPPLDLAIMHGRSEAFLLLFKGSLSELGFEDVDGNGDDKKMYPLYLAAKYQRVEMVRVLLSKGAHVNVKNYEDRTPLGFAIEHGVLAGMLDWFVTLMDDYGVSSLVSTAAVEIARLLIDAGADPPRDGLLRPHAARLKRRFYDASPPRSKNKCSSPRRNPPRKCRRLA